MASVISASGLTTTTAISTVTTRSEIPQQINIRDRDWIFHTLWSSCNARGTSKCQINIPLTIIFRKGEPNKAISTDPNTGCIIRVPLDEYTEVQRDIDEHGFRGEVLRKFRAVRKLLIHYNQINKNDLSQHDDEEEVIICTATYADTTTEDLNLRTLDILIRNESWRTQLIYIQAFIPMSRSKKGIYNKEKEDEEKKSQGKGKQLPLPKDQVKINNLIKEIKKFAEKAYITKNEALLASRYGNDNMSVISEEKGDDFSEINNEINSVNIPTTARTIITAKTQTSQSQYTGISTDQKGLDIIDIEGVFNFDKDGKCYFMNCTYIAAMVKKNKDQIDEFIENEKKSRILTAAYSIAKDLLELLKHGEKRRLSISESFSHFDIKNNGIIDYNDLASGLGKLGIGVTIPVATAVIQLIGGIGTKYLSQDDFNRFLQVDPNSLEDSISHILETDNIKTISNEMDIYGGFGVSKSKSSKSKRYYKNDDSTINLPLNMEKEIPVSLKPSQRFDTEPLDDDKNINNNGKKDSSISKRAVKEFRKTQALDKVKPIRRKRVDNNHYSLSAEDFKDDIDGKEKLSLVTIYKEMNGRMRRHPDELLHVDESIVMSFRIVSKIKPGDEASWKSANESANNTFALNTARTNEGVAEEKANPDIVTADDITINSAAFSALDDEDKRGFTLIVIPDLFMTLEALKKNLEEIIVSYPFSRIVFVGLPGFPNTMWREGWALNSDLNARCIAKLLQYLESKNRLGPPDDPMFLMGFGSGVLSLARFITLYLPELPWLRRRIKSVVIVNGMLKHSNGYKQILKDLRSSMINASAFEFQELVSSLHFSDEFLRRTGPTKVLNRFWSTRTDLRSDDVTEENTGSGYFGVLEQMRGMLSSVDDYDGADILLSRLPLIVVQSTEDVFVNPRHATMFQQDMLPPDRVLVNDISEIFIKKSSTCVCWLKSGHEVLEERNAFMLGLISNMAKLSGLQQFNLETQNNFQYSDKMVKDLMGLVLKRKEDIENEIIDAEESTRKEVEEKAIEKQRRKDERNAKRTAKLLQKANDEQARQLKHEQEALERKMKELKDATALAEVEAELAKLKEQKRAIEEAQNAMAEERRLRKEMAEKLAAQERLRQEEEKVNERNELKEMSVEDAYSRKIEKSIRDYEEALKNDKKLKQREEKRKRLERERNQREIEEENEKVKQVRLMTRKLKLDGYKQVIFETADALLKDVDDYSDDSPKVMELVTAGYKQLPIVWSNYDRLVDGFMRQQQMEQKLEKCKFLRDASANDFKRLARTVELVTASPNLVGASTPEGAQKDINELNHLVELKKASYRELDHYCEKRALQLKELQKQVEILEKKFEAEEKKMVSILQDALDYEGFLSNKLNDLKVARERNIADKGRAIFRQQGIFRKKEIIEKEMARIQNHKDKYIDSELDGATKRFETDALRMYLEKCITQEDYNIKEIDKKLKKYDFDIGYSVYHVATVQSYYERLVFSIKYLRVRNRTISKVPASEFAKLFALRLEGAVKKHERDQIEKATRFRMISEVGTTNVIERVRYKSHDLRSDDEKRFIGLDLILHPEMYVSLKSSEIEELRFDKKYYWELKKSDLLRIKTLPQFPNLALPFLNTLEEVEAHRLFNWYLHKRNDKFFEGKDYHSVEVVEDYTHHHHHHHKHNDQQSHNDVIEAAQLVLEEIEQDIMVKETLRNKIRWHCYGEPITTEELEWLHMDQILCQYLYGSEKAETDYHEEKKHCWRCPFSYNDLVELHETDVQAYYERKKRQQEIDWGWASLKLSDCQHAKMLLDKYYISEDETILGYARITGIESIAKHILENLAEENARLLSNRKKAMNRKSVELVYAKSSIERVWGPYDEVHPAALGATSQGKYFTRAGYQPSREHPAAYAIHPRRDEDDSSASSFGSESELPTGIALREIGLKVLLSLPGDSVDKHGNEHHPGQDIGAAIINMRQSFLTSSITKAAAGSSDEFCVVKNAHELAKQDPKELQDQVALIIREEPYVLFEAQDLNLMGRASRLHKFQIPDKEDLRILDITVSIIFQGEFTEKGYAMGRLAASLFRLSSNTHDNKVPEAVGWSPYAMQAPNLPGGFGRLVILHRPRIRPLRTGWYQVVLGAAANTKYSIRIVGTCAQTALPVIDGLILKVKETQSYLPTILRQLEVSNETLTITEMKKAIAEKLLDEAKREHDRSQKLLKKLTRDLKMDDQQMTLMEAERKQLEEDLDNAENEFDWWSTCLMSRTKELEDITTGLGNIKELVATKEREKMSIKEKLEKDRHDLPACIAVLRGYKEACHVAHSLNTTVAVTNSGIAALAADTIDDAPIEVTPANVLRKRLKNEGYNSLLIQEKQWFMLDLALNPYNYEWLKEKEEKEMENRLAMGVSAENAQMYEAEVEAFRMTKTEVVRIKAQPYHLLNRKEMIVRKLLTKYHDDPELLRKSQAVKTSSFDNHLAERVRIKNPRFFTEEEREWSSIDRIIHADIWNFYSQHDGTAVFDEKNALAAKSFGNDPNSKVQSKALTQKANKKDAPGIDQAKLDNKKKLEKILGMSAGNDNDLGDMNDLTKSIRSRAKKQAALQKMWTCQFNAEKIINIWKTPRHKLQDKDDQKVHRLLSKYNGLYNVYMQQKRESEAKKVKTHFSLIKQENHERNDMDQYLRDVVSEIDRVKRCTAPYTSTSVFHGSEQMYPTKQLHEKLEMELVTQLENQIKERERSSRHAIEDVNSDDAYLSSEDEEEDDDEEGGGKSFAEKMQLKMRKKRAQGLADAKKEKKDDKKKHKKVNVKGKKGVGLAEAIFLNSLGVGGCLGCRARSCQWQTSVDEELLQIRLHALEREVERVRGDKDSSVFVSDVSLSAQLGGNNKFTRVELLDELENEGFALRLNLNLDRVDKELHDAYASRAEFVEVESLHGYKMMLWTNNARLALQARQNHLIAMTVARDVVDEILEWMLEGWMFGERESQFNIIGYVPSVKKDGRIKGGQDQIKAIGAVSRRMLARAQAKKDNVILDEARRGLMIDKSIPINIDAQNNLQKEKLELDGKRVDNLLNETETTMKFGMFMLTLMYFRSMTLVQREKKSWSGEGDDIGMKSKAKKMTDERMRMVDEDQKIEARKKRLEGVMERCKRGIQKQVDKETMIRREIIMKRVLAKKKAVGEIDAICIIQRVYRGFIARRNARRWALKRAELQAMHQLLSKTSITLQRVWRGVLARKYLITRRMEMAQFIAFIRVQEAENDEEAYWKTHPWSRFKKDFKDWRQKTFVRASNREALGKSRLTKEEEEALALMNDDDNEESDDDSDTDSSDDEAENEGVPEDIDINTTMDNISLITEPTMKK